MDLAAGLAGLRTAVELARGLRDAAKAGTIKQDEFAGRVGEIYDYITDSKDALVDAKDQIQDLKDQRRELKEQIQKLRAAAEEEKDFHFMHGVYWKTSIVQTTDVDENGDRIRATHWDGPFCPLCKDVNQKAVRLKDVGSFQKSADRSWLCEIHSTDYRAPTMQS